MEELDIFNCVEETPKEIREQIKTIIANGINPESAAVLKARAYYIKPEVLSNIIGETVEEVSAPEETPKEPELTKDKIIEKLVAGGLVEGEHFKKSDKKEKLLEILSMLSTEETKVEETKVETTEETK